MKKTFFIGTVAGLAMGVALLVTGGVAAFILYGLKMVPEGKFTSSQINVGYFFWTKSPLAGHFALGAFPSPGL
jgi:hypothetical protein